MCFIYKEREKRFSHPAVLTNHSNLLNCLSVECKFL